MNNPPDIPDTKQTGDVRAQRIAKVYAEALYEAASKAGQLEAVIDELGSLIRDVLSKDTRFKVLLSSAAMGRDARAGVIAKAFKERLNPTLYSFLQVLNSHERLELLHSVAHAIHDMDNERKRRVQVLVTSAIPLSTDELDKIGEVIRSKMHLEPVMSPIIDPSILGGVKIRVGDRQYDATVRTRIENIRNQILTSSSHEIQSRRDRFSSAN